MAGFFCAFGRSGWCKEALSVNLTVIGNKGNRFMATKKKCKTASRRPAKLHVAASNPDTPVSAKPDEAVAPKPVATVAEVTPAAATQAQSPAASVAAAMGAAAALHRSETLAEQNGAADGFDADGDGNGPEAFKRRDLIQSVSDRADVKKSEVRDVIDVILDEIAKALHEGKDLVLPPIGKISIKRRAEQANGDVLTAKIKLKPRGDAGADDASEQTD